MEENEVYCSACGVEIDLKLDQAVYMDEVVFCAWCWSNDCCRVSRDAAERRKREEK